MTSDDPATQQPLLFGLYKDIAKISGVLPTRLWVSPDRFDPKAPYSTTGGASLYRIALNKVACMACRPLRADAFSFLGDLWVSYQVRDLNE